MELANVILNGASLVVLLAIFYRLGNHEGRILNLETWRSNVAPSQPRSDHV